MEPWSDTKRKDGQEDVSQDANGTMTRALLAWYDANRRVLPWREDPAPYHVWLSEIMLQQTRVEAVKPYYARFLEALPTVEALAAAPEDVYLKLWEGLGYYSRVRNLHKAAVAVVEQYGGSMPGTYRELLQLPGIGEYTAAAIASIAFGEAVPAIDGNLLRIFSRLTGYGANILAADAKKAAREFYSSWISANRPGAFNQALMDLGATVCLPNAVPLCAACPLETACLAHAEGRERALPVRPEKKKRAIDRKTVLIIHHDRRIVLQKRPEAGLLAGLYEFPNAEGWLTQKQALQQVEALGFTTLRIRKLPAAKHIFSHREWHMHGYEIHTGDWTDPGRTGPFAQAPDSAEPTDLAAPAGPADMAEEALAGASAPGAQTAAESKTSYAGTDYFAEADHAASTDDPAAPAEIRTIGGQRIFLASPEELETRWSIPSAFAAYREAIAQS